MVHEVLQSVVISTVQGFHYYVHELKEMPNASEALKRRGAHWTFDTERFVKALERLRQNMDDVIKLPSFDHGIGDPVEDEIQISRDTQLVIVEGNYLLIGKN